MYWGNRFWPGKTLVKPWETSENLGNFKTLEELTDCGEVRDLLQQEYRGDSRSSRTCFQRSLYLPERNRRLSRGFSPRAVFRLIFYKALIFKGKLVMRY